MERKSLIMRPIKVNTNKNKVNNLNNNNNGTNEQYYSGSDSGVSGDLLIRWPPRSYSCSFCEREFRSAQALGGHMNVHRKDRARQLRQSPPPPPRDHHHNININAQPSEDSWIRPRSPSSSPSKMFSPFASTLRPLVSPSLSALSPHSPGKIKKCVGNFKKHEINLGLDLEIDLLKDSKEHLDLELRLGYS